MTGLRDRWIAQVLRTTRVSDATKVLLVALSQDMDSRGYVSTMRPVLAERIGRSERRVSERLSDAVAARFLDHVVRGHRGVTPVYRAMLPGADSGTVHSPLSEGKRDGLEPAFASPDRLAMDGNSGTPGGPTTTRAGSQERSRRASAVEQFTSEKINEVEPPTTAPRPKVHLSLVQAQTCKHDDPHPELCQRCAAERRRSA